MAHSKRKAMTNARQSIKENLCLYIEKKRLELPVPLVVARRLPPPPPLVVLLTTLPSSNPPSSPSPSPSTTFILFGNPSTSGISLKIHPGKFAWSTPHPRHLNPRDLCAKNKRLRAGASIPPTSTAFVAICERRALTRVRTVQTGCHVS